MWRVTKPLAISLRRWRVPHCPSRPPEADKASSRTCRATSPRRLNRAAQARVTTSRP
nr:MAG TPA: hypothetical protein [Caudoviricetes sp.]